MRARRIDADTIKVLIFKADLHDYGITIFDLLNNNKKIKNFFYKILKMVDVDHQFSNDDTLIFKVHPNARGLDLFIMRNHRANISNSDNRIEENSTSQMLSKNQISTYVIALHSFEDFVSIAHLLKIVNGISSLYKYQGRYYLVLQMYLDLDGNSQSEIENKLAVAYEFGSQSNLTLKIISKHGQRLISRNALGIARYYFN